MKPQPFTFDHAKSLFELPLTNRDFAVKITEMNGTQPFLYHWHDAVEILYGLEKDTRVGVLERSYILRENDIMVIGPGESHCLFPSDHRARRLALIFEPSLVFAENRFPDYKNCFSQVKKHSAQWPSEAKQKMKAYISTICEECSEQRSGWEISVYSQLLAMTALAVRGLPKKPEKAPPKEDSLLRKTLAYLSAEYLHDISLDTCAKALGFNKAYLSTQFKKQSGISFHRYLLDLRLNKAKLLLATSDQPISVIAEESGFSNSKTFHRVFYEEQGISPGQYRKEIKK